MNPIEFKLTVNKAITMHKTKQYNFLIDYTMGIIFFVCSTYDIAEHFEDKNAQPHYTLTTPAWATGTYLSTYLVHEIKMLCNHNFPQKCPNH